MDKWDNKTEAMRLVESINQQWEGPQGESGPPPSNETPQDIEMFKRAVQHWDSLRVPEGWELESHDKQEESFSFHYSNQQGSTVHVDVILDGQHSGIHVNGGNNHSDTPFKINQFHQAEQYLQKLMQEHDNNHPNVNNANGNLSDHV